MEVLKSSNCVLLELVPEIGSLQRLEFSGCPLITHVPYIGNLEYLDCHNCPLLMSMTHFSSSLDIIIVYGCPWFDYRNPDFEDIARSLTKIQRWIKKRMFLIKYEYMFANVLSVPCQPMSGQPGYGEHKFGELGRIFPNGGYYFREAFEEVCETIGE